MEPLPTIDQYKLLLEKHDWWYDKSDDMKIWKRGSEEEIKLSVWASQDKMLKRLYDEKRKQIYS